MHILLIYLKYLKKQNSVSYKDLIFDRSLLWQLYDIVNRFQPNVVKMCKTTAN